MERQKVYRGTPPHQIQRALAFYNQGDLKRAERVYRKILEKDPSDPNALNLLGVLEHERGRSDEAVRLIRRAIQYYPTQPLLYLNLGVIFESRKCYTEAIACYQRCARLDPTEAYAYFNLAVVYGALSESEVAAGFYRKAIEVAPSLRIAYDNLVYVLDLSSTSTAEQRYAARRLWNDTFGRPLHEAHHVPLENDPDPERPLRVGYVSSDFHQHSAWLVFSSVMLGHTDTVEVYAYASDTRDDDAARRLKAGRIAWRVVKGKTDREIAEMVRADGIDVLVDLSGYTAGNHLELFAIRPAPVQVTAWGYATGTGLDQMDAFFTDRVATPPDHAPYYAEELVYLPSVVAYNHPADMPDVEALPARDLGMVTFGSFNQPKKLSQRTLQLWARVLAAVPNSRLVLRHAGLDQTHAEERVRDVLEDAGIATGRVHLFGGSHHWEHIAAFRDLDVQLDCQPASGGMTTLEAAWMGVPTLTLDGDRTAARISASIMTTLGHADWVTPDDDAFVRAAVGWANDLDRLEAVRLGLRERLRTSVICDAPRYVAHVEAAYRELWRRWCQRQHKAVA